MHGKVSVKGMLRKPQSRLRNRAASVRLFFQTFHRRRSQENVHHFQQMPWALVLRSVATTMIVKEMRSVVLMAVVMYAWNVSSLSVSFSVDEF